MRTDRKEIFYGSQHVAVGAAKREIRRTEVVPSHKSFGFLIGFRDFTGPRDVFALCFRRPTNRKSHHETRSNPPGWCGRIRWSPKDIYGTVTINYTYIYIYTRKNTYNLPSPRREDPRKYILNPQMDLSHVSPWNRGELHRSYIPLRLTYTYAPSTKARN